MIGRLYNIKLEFAYAYCILLSEREDRDGQGK